MLKNFTNTSATVCGRTTQSVTLRTNCPFLLNLRVFLELNGTVTGLGAVSETQCFVLPRQVLGLSTVCLGRCEHSNYNSGAYQNGCTETESRSGNKQTLAQFVCGTNLIQSWFGPTAEDLHIFSSSQLRCALWVQDDFVNNYILGKWPYSSTARKNAYHELFKILSEWLN